MFHGRPYGIGAGPTMEEGNSANASQLRSLATDFTWNYLIFFFLSNFKRCPPNFQQEPSDETIFKNSSTISYLKAVGTEI